MSNNRDYATRDHAIRARLATYDELHIAFRAAGLPDPLASCLAHREAISMPGLWTVGFYDPTGKWHAESDHDNSEAAARRVAWLNGANVSLEE